MHKPELIIFDINETLLDLTLINDQINQKLGSEYAATLWFKTLLHYSLVETVTQNYLDFGAIGNATLKMTAAHFNKELSDTSINDILSKIKELPPHLDVIEALTLLKNKNYKLAALTNGGVTTLKHQLNYAQLTHFFENIYSVEEVKKFKPHPLTYHFVADAVKIPIKNCLMVAAHSWDILGAQRSKLQTAFIKRDKKELYPLLKPDYIFNDLLELAQQL